ncbi:MAG: sigma-70 family RNA polymerase sigma factor [Archangiaceae bacterium]|nr:sigma-70 family RNA polymerase sigma factor [Archangiaceae bacterium]
MTVEDEDAALFMRVAKGDQGAFATLFDRHQASIVRFAHRFVGNAARAEELAQDIFVKLYQHAKSYRPDAKFKTFMFRVATNHCLNEVRRPAHKAEAAVAVLPDTRESPETPDGALDGRQLEQAVGVALHGMSERERAAFCMCRFEGLPYKEIAHALEASEAAVKSLIHRASLQVLEQVELLKAGLAPKRSEA